MRFGLSGSGAVGAILLLLLALWPAPVAAQTVKFGAVVPLTGRYGGGGAQVRAGYEIAVEHLNAAGGVAVGGKKMPLELALLDDESDATKTVSRLETLAAQGVVAYLGGFGSDLHAAAASVAEKNKTPYLGVAFALHKVHEQGFKYLFSPFWKSPDIKTYTVDLLNSIPAAERPKAAAISHTKKIGRPADPITGPAYANVQILAAAISHAGSLDKDKIRDAIAATDMTTVIGPVKFRPDGTGIVNAVFVQWLNGKQELVFPKEAATAPLGYPAPPFAKR